MSTDWGIGCVTCTTLDPLNVPRATFENARYSDLPTLRKFIEHAGIIAAAHQALGHELVSFRGGSHWYGMGDLGPFMVKHLGHDLKPVDEYGRFDDQCHKWVTCSECANHHDCGLKENHEPPCKTHRAIERESKEPKT